MNEMPREADVPHWAVARVREVRRNLKIPVGVSDRMIYARLVDTGGRGTKQGQIDALKALAGEVRDAS